MQLQAELFQQENGDDGANLPLEQEDPRRERTLNQEDRNVLRSIRYAHDGHIGRAARALMQKPPADVANPEVMAALQALHPRCPTEVPALPANAELSFLAPDRRLKSMIFHKVANGSAPGPSGWTGEMMATIARNDDCLAGIAALLNDIRNGTLPDEARPYLLSARLMAVDKNPGIRPIAVGEAFYRAASITLLTANESIITRALQPFQFAIGTPGGCEAAIHIAQALLNDPSVKRAGISFDLRNAFNERNRAEILQSLFERQDLAPFFRIAHWAYKDRSPLFLENGQIIWSENGVKQGDVLGLLFFVISLIGILNHTSRANQQATLIAVADDLTVIGEPDAVLACARALEEKVQDPIHGLHLQHDKAQSYWFHDQAIPEDFIAFITQRRIPMFYDSAILLGAPIGRTATPAQCLRMAAQIQSRTQKHDRLFNLLTHQSMPAQISTRILSASMVPRMNYLARTVDPRSLQDAAAQFDRQIATTLQTTLKLPRLNDDSAALQQISLPVRYGGLGLRRATKSLAAAYIGAHAQAAPHLQQAFPNGLPPNHPMRAAINQALAKIRRSIGPLLARSWLPPNRADTIAHFCSAPAQELAPHFQRSVTALSESRAFQSMLNAANAETKARFLSCSGPLAGVWLTAPLNNPRTRMDDAEFACAVRLRVGLPPEENVNSTCSCPQHQSLQDEPWHGLSCLLLKRKAINQRHNDVVHIIADTVRRIYGFAHIEPSRLAETRIRPDLAIQMRARRIFADVAIVHPSAPSHQRVARRQMATANEAERRKHRKYDNLAHSQRGVFLPFVVETYGAFGGEARTLIRQITSFAGQERPSQSKHATLVRLMSEVAVAIQKGNAHAALQCIQDAEGMHVGGA